MSDYIDCYYSRTVSGATRYSKLDNKIIHTDVCIIGGGFAGLSTAYSLGKRGQSSVVLEGRRIGYGASGRNGGFVLPGYSTGVNKLAKIVGMPNAKRMFQFTLDGVEMIRARVKEHKIDCHQGDGMLRVSWWDVGTGIKDYTNFMKKEFDVDVRYISKDELTGLCRTTAYHDAVLYNNCFSVHALNYVHGLAKAANEMGADIYEDAMVTEVIDEGDTKIVRTANGIVHAKQIVYCGSAYSNNKVYKKVETSCVPVATFMMITEPVTQDLLNETINNRHAIYDTRWASDYYRVLPDNRILWGGRCQLNEKSSDKVSHDMKADMVKVYPKLVDVKVDLAWSGFMGYNMRKMPHIGTDGKGSWYCTHFGGVGYSGATMGGDKIAAGITGENEDYKLFEPFGFCNSAGIVGRTAASVMYKSWRMADCIKDIGKKSKDAVI